MEDLNQNKIDNYLYEAERYEAESLYNIVGAERQAIEIYSKVLKIAPTNFEALYSRARLYNFLGDYDKALEDLNLANKIYPNSFNVSFSKAEANYYIGNYQLAVDDSEYGIRLLEEFLERTKSEISLEQYLDRYRAYVNSYIIRGHAYVAIGEYDKALRDYGYAINTINRFMVVLKRKGRTRR